MFRSSAKVCGPAGWDSRDSALRLLFLFISDWTHLRFFSRVGAAKLKQSTSTARLELHSEDAMSQRHVVDTKKVSTPNSCAWNWKWKCWVWVGLLVFHQRDDYLVTVAVRNSDVNSECVLPFTSMHWQMLIQRYMLCGNFPCNVSINQCCSRVGGGLVIRWKWMESNCEVEG